MNKNVQSLLFINKRNSEASWFVRLTNIHKQLPDLQSTILLAGLLFSTAITAIEQIHVTIGELENTHHPIDNIKGLSSRIDFIHNNQLAAAISTHSITLLPPYDGIQAVQLGCSALTTNETYIRCNSGNLTLTLSNDKQFSIPFQFQQTTHSENGQFRMTPIPFANKESQMRLRWQQKKWDFLTAINTLSLTPLSDLLHSAGISISDGFLTINAEAASPATNLLNANLRFSGTDISLQTHDASKAVEKLKIESHLQAGSTQATTQGKLDFYIHNGEIYLQPVYLSLNKASISGDTHFLLDNRNQNLKLTDFTLNHFPNFSLSGDLETTLEQKFPPNQGNIKVQIYNLANLFNHYIAPFLRTNSVKPTLSNTQGLILSELDFTNKQLDHLQLSTADVSATYTFNHQDISINNARISLNWRPDHCSEQSFVYWKTANFRGVPLPETVLRFKACGQQINFERNVTLPLLDGEMQFDHLDLKKLDNGNIDFSFATEINNISLAALSEAFDLPPLAGHLSASIPSVRLEKGGLQLDSSIQINVFGGTIEIEDLQIDGMLGSYPVLTANINFKKLDLGKLSKRFSFGNIEGKLNGRITGLRIENQNVVAFDAAFSTPEDRLLPYSISQKAVENIASLGGTNPADLLSRGVLKMFESFFYSRLGFRCKLRNNVCELEGIATAKNNGFYLIKGMLAPQINVIGYNHRVNWSELATRLKRITSQSSPVIN